MALMSIWQYCTYKTMQSKPIFNKRLYKAQAGITISKQAYDVLTHEATRTRSEKDLRVIRASVSGLKEIHKNFEFVKAALGCAVTYERHECDRRIGKTELETEMQCYYILSGSVEAFYKVKNAVATGNGDKEGSISYTHVAGDYIGLVSADGARFDLPPPEFMITIEHSEFLKIDRQVFHDKIQQAQKQFRDEITSFLDSHKIFEKISEEDRHKLISQMGKQEFPAGKQILSQGKKQEYAFFIAEGRCRYYRRIFLPEEKRSELFKMGYVEKGSYFDSSCILNDQASKFSVSAVGPVTCYLLNKWTIKNSESLLRALSLNRPSFQSDKKIERLIKESDQWQSYKRDTVCLSLAVRNRSSRIIPQDRVSRDLRRAIRSGTALRHHRRQELTCYPRDGLDASQRNSLKTPAPQDEGETGSRHMTSVIKAIMLLRRFQGSIHKTENEEMNDDTLKDDSQSQKETGSYSKLLKHREKRSKYISGIIGENAKGISKENKQSFSVLSKDENVPNTTKRNTSPDLKTDDTKVTPSIRRSVPEDRWVTNEQKFVVKEIVNTRIPGKPYPVTAEYRRFGPSMFESLDKLNMLQKGKFADPQRAEAETAKWLKKTMTSFATGQNDYNPGASPVIVIQEFCEKHYDSDEDGENGDKSRDKAQASSATQVHQGSLETLVEDRDRELAEEDADKDEWRTAVHDTRDDSERCLKQARERLEQLERRLAQLGWSRDTLLAKERKKEEERRMKGNKSEEKKIDRSRCDKDEKENQEVVQVQNERRHRTLKRQDSIQRILEERYLVKSTRRRGRSAEDNVHAKHPVGYKRHSASSLHSRRTRFRARTFTVS